jgi:NTP pyrophosphatase (non-canonical NTP hydrolase)
MTHFNQLSPAQAESLALLLEELGEAQQAIGKMLRHGAHSYHPDTGAVNRETLARELGDIRAAVHIAVKLCVVDEEHIASATYSKLQRVGEYLHHIEAITWRPIP